MDILSVVLILAFAGALAGAVVRFFREARKSKGGTSTGFWLAGWVSAFLLLLLTVFMVDRYVMVIPVPLEPTRPDPPRLQVAPKEPPPKFFVVVPGTTTTPAIERQQSPAPPVQSPSKQAMEEHRLMLDAWVRQRH